MKLRVWILVLGLYTVGWLALMTAFLFGNFDQSFRWIGGWENLGCVGVLASAVGPLLAVVVLVAGPVSPRISEDTKKRSKRRARIFLVTTIVAAFTLQLTFLLELGRVAQLGGCLLVGWVVLMAPWVGLHHRWFTDTLGEF